MAKVPLDISVPSWNTISSPDSGKFTVYNIEVAYDCKKWTVQRRFTLCESLNSQMVKQFHISTDLFPAAPIFILNNFSIKFLEERRVELEKYFRKISHLVVGFQPAEDFFGIGDTSIPFTLTYTKNLFFRPGFVSGLGGFPATITVGNATILVQGLVGTTFTLISNLQDIENGIYKASDLAKRIAKMDESSERRKSIVSELAPSIATLADIMGHATALQTATGKRLFNAQQDTLLREIFEAGEKAVNWASSIEEQLLSGLDSNTATVPEVSEPLPPRSKGPNRQPSQASPSVVPPSSGSSKLEKLRKQAEVALALFVSAQSSDERKNAIDAIDALLGYIEEEIKLATIRNTGELQALNDLKVYVLEGKAWQLQDANSLVSQSDIQFFEETLFSFLDALTKLDDVPIYPNTEHNASFPTPSAPPAADVPSHPLFKSNLSREQIAQSFLNETEKLRSALASSRISLERHQAAHPEDHSVNSLLNRITDIQEHLVEIQYQLKSKYLPTALPPPNALPRAPRSLDDEFEL